MLARFRLSQPLETAVVCDSLVWHNVTPIAVAPGAHQGTRDVILVDFTPWNRVPGQLVPGTTG